VAVSFEECHGDIPKDIYDKVSRACSTAAAAALAWATVSTDWRRLQLWQGVLLAVANQRM
jgi:hypothetical protein